MGLRRIGSNFVPRKVFKPLTLYADVFFFFGKWKLSHLFYYFEKDTVEVGQRIL